MSKYVSGCSHCGKKLPLTSEMSSNDNNILCPECKKTNPTEMKPCCSSCDNSDIQSYGGG